MYAGSTKGSCLLHEEKSRRMTITETEIRCILFIINSLNNIYPGWPHLHLHEGKPQGMKTIRPGLFKQKKFFMQVPALFQKKPALKFFYLHTGFFHESPGSPALKHV
jgi:hypothetical protein